MKSDKEVIDGSEVQMGGLFLGNYYAATNISLLKSRNIWGVLTIANDLNISYNNVNSLLKI